MGLVPFENQNKIFLRRKNEKHSAFLPVVGAEQDVPAGD
jgi:hypothetical protein